MSASVSSTPTSSGANRPSHGDAPTQGDCRGTDIDDLIDGEANLNGIKTRSSAPTMRASKATQASTGSAEMESGCGQVVTCLAAACKPAQGGAKEVASERPCKPQMTQMPAGAFRR